MRTQIIFRSVVIALAAICFSSCKKDNNNSVPDNSSLFKNTVWTGEFNYTGKDVEPISMAFNENGGLTWHEVSGDFTGNWKLENGKLTISLSSAVSFKADISANQLTNIENTDANGRKLSNAGLNANADDLLDNTTWTAPNLLLVFKAGNKIDMTLGAGTHYYDLPYTRKDKSIRFNAITAYKWFLITNSNISMKGSNTFTGDPAVYPFEMAKQ